MPFNRAFTLLELLVVITIIGILSSIVIVSMSGSTDSATIAKGKAYAQQIHALLGHKAVGVWNFDEGTDNTCSGGEDVCDISGYGNHGTFYGETQFIDSDIEGYALSFDGTGDYVDCGNGESFNITSAITVLYWESDISPVHTSGRVGKKSVFDISRRGVSDVYAHVYVDGAYQGLYGTDKLTPGVWHHVVMTYDSLTRELAVFIDGIKELSKILTGLSEYTLNTSAYNLEIGRMGYQGTIDYFNGLIDEVRIYSETLPATEIQKHYVQGLNKLLTNQAITQAEYDERMEEFNQYLVSNRF
jgi:prepilin-type N-terminal cleavage/methylation domain-containing protein